MELLNRTALELIQARRLSAEPSPRLIHSPKQEGPNNVFMACPFARDPRLPHKNRIDQSRGLGIKIEPFGTSPWGCFTCKMRGGSVVKFLHALEARFNLSNHDLWEAHRFVRDFDRFNPEMISTLPKTYSEAVAGDAPPPALPEEVLAEMKGCVPAYIVEERNFTLATCERWEMGYDRRLDRLTFPVRDETGALKGVQGRAIYDHQSPPYLAYGDTDWPTQALFGLQFANFSQPVILCEGILDTVRLDELGLWGWGLSSVAQMGSNLSRWQIEYLATRYPEIWFLYDDDPAGRMATKRAIEYLGRRTRTSVLRYPERLEGKDPEKMGHPDLVYAIKERAEGKTWAAVA